ncbi:sortase [Agromyces seonyuensis]|uniref:Sortase n=1 Tax=Agromyces seonyuensis TaxID=2662446 RepID=A0A6I4NUH7_9MICO|nr:sortase [Agromyces seonyuensis]MWB97883.1 sortase [Agromyces seonyuensis]
MDAPRTAPSYTHPAPNSPKAPKPPRRPPAPPVQYALLTPVQAFWRALLALIAALALSFGAYLFLFSHLQHFAAQQRLADSYRVQLADGTAPVSEGDFEDVLLEDGDPVGIIDIPQLGVHEVISEGTSAPVLAGGPGHLRSTVLPGQAGVSILMGRAAAYGGPFSRIQELAPGDRFTVRTGQGEIEFETIGLRYAGDATPPAPVRGESRLILQTARGMPYAPTGIAYVDARSVEDALPAGARQTTTLSLAPEDKALATDTTTVWALVFALQFLIVAEIAAVWAFRRIGAQRTWIVFVPVLLIGGLFAADQVVRLLPNLL